jgi:CheY-like chemotaxis protein
MADILLVDDSKTMRLLVQRALRQAGYKSLMKRKTACMPFSN